MTQPQPDANGRIPTTVTFLAMLGKPNVIPPQAPHNPLGPAAIVQAHRPPVHFYRYLYDTIGGPHYWVDRKKISDTELETLLADPAIELHLLYVGGVPAGMAELDFRKGPIARLAYFGLIPDFHGQKLSYYFLYHTVCNAWSHPIATLKVNTCTLDSPRALTLYQRIGFSPYSREDRYVELP